MTTDEKVSRLIYLYFTGQKGIPEYNSLCIDNAVVRQLFRMTDEEIQERMPK